MQKNSRTLSPPSYSYSSRSPSPNSSRMQSPSNYTYFGVPQKQVFFYFFFLLSNIIFFLLSLHYSYFIVPFFISIVCTILTWKNIERASLYQAGLMMRDLTPEQINAILHDPDSPFVDNYVRKKLSDINTRVNNQ